MAKVPTADQNEAPRRFSLLVREAREKSFKSGREFYAQAGFTFGYTRYAQIESGTATLPSMEAAVEIVRALGISMRQGLFAWAYDQAPDSDSKSVFIGEGESDADFYDDTCRPAAQKMSKVAANFIAQEPLYWEILLLLASYREADTLTTKEIAKALKIDVKRTGILLSWLSDHGLVESSPEGSFYTKKFFSLPLSEEFRALRLQIADAAHSNFKGQPHPAKYAATLTRSLSPSQTTEIHRKVAALFSWIDQLPWTSPGQEASLRSISVFDAPRTFAILKAESAS